MKLVSSVFAALVLFAATASADTSPQAGTRGTVTGYQADGKTVVLVRACAKQRLGFAYAVCGPVLRADVKKAMCERGKGTYPWKYQVGDGPLLSQVATCR